MDDQKKNMYDAVFHVGKYLKELVNIVFLPLYKMGLMVPFQKDLKDLDPSFKSTCRFALGEGIPGIVLEEKNLFYGWITEDWLHVYGDFGRVHYHNVLKYLDT